MRDNFGETLNCCDMDWLIWIGSAPHVTHHYLMVLIVIDKVDSLQILTWGSFSSSDLFLSYMDKLSSEFN
jgi:hypothetical protein